MFYLKKLSAFVPVFLIVGFMFLALPEKGYAGIFIPGGPPCCQIIANEFRGCVGGEEAPEFCEGEGQDGFICQNADCEFFGNSVCVVEGEGEDQTGFCVGTGPTTKNIPTLSEWGLLAMAGAFGIIGFLILRRRKTAA